MEIRRPEIVNLYNQKMGGVDLLDQMLQYYRIFLKSKKWTLRMIMHFFDLAITAAWYDYKSDCDALHIPTKDRMDFLGFKTDLGEAMVLTNTSKKRGRGRPSNEKPEEEPPKRLRLEVQKDQRYDEIGHFPLFSDDKNSSRCRLEMCSQKTFIFCCKCQVSLCVKRGSDCFYKFHSNP